MKIETKYSLEQSVWLISNNKISEGSVDGITIDVTRHELSIKYMVKPVRLCKESELFASKADLINSLLG